MTNNRGIRRSNVKHAAALALSFVTAAALLGSTGCGARNHSNNMNAQSYGHDGYMGMSNSNPRLPNRNGNQLNYGSDARFAERKLRELGGVNRVNITFQGINLYASIEPKKGVDEAQLRHKAISTLRYNMPRYIVHVKTGRA